MKDICYFDNAATTFPKPPEVISEVSRCINEYCGNAGRGSHKLALASAEIMYETRETAREMFSCPSADRVVFTLNATYALNLAIQGLLKYKDHVLISDMEHNSVLRPVAAMAEREGITYSVFSTRGNVLENIRSKIRPNTAALICTHASNITNAVLPIEKIGRMLRERGILFVVDASQSAGCRAVNMDRACIDALCVPSHKGLLGPQGAGMVMFSEGVTPRPLISGGSGSMSKLPEMPAVLPDRLEAGTMPTPTVAGLLAGMKYVKNRGVWSIWRHECEIIESIKRRFAGNGRIVTYSGVGGGIWLFNVRGVGCQTVARHLSAEGVCVRAGLHCAPLAHKTLGTAEDGAVRVSAGPMNTPEDAEFFVSKLSEVLKKI